MTPEYLIDPELAPILAALPTGAPSSDFEQKRRLTREIVAQMPLPDITVTDLTVPGVGSQPDIPVRGYVPDQVRGPAGLLSVHGGGFTSSPPRPHPSRAPLAEAAVG